MTHFETLELKATDLQLLGRFYQNDFPLEVNVSDDCVDLVPPQSILKPLFIMTSLIGLIYAGFIWIIVANDINDKFGPLIWVLLILVGVIAIAGPILAHQFRIQHMRAISPLVSYCVADSSVSILGGQHVFALDEVYALLGLTLPDSHGESKSELQLVVQRDNALVPYLITTNLSGSAEASFGKNLREFGAASQLKTLVAEPDGWFNRGPLRIRELDVSNERSIG